MISLPCAEAGSCVSTSKPFSASLASKLVSASPTSATRSTGRVCSDSRPTEASDSVQVRDQAAQVQGLVQQAAHFLVADRDDAVADRVQAGAEHRDGRAQLVRDGGQRHALFPVQRFERIDHVIEIPHHFGHFAACLAHMGPYREIPSATRVAAAAIESSGRVITFEMKNPDARPSGSPSSTVNSSASFSPRMGSTAQYSP